MTHVELPSERIRPKKFRERLWWIALAPTLWATHFLVCYVTVAIWCEKKSGSEEPDLLYWLIGGYSILAVLGIVYVGWLSFETFRHGESPIIDEHDEPRDRAEFIGFTGFLLALLSGVATIFTIMVFVIVRGCH